MLFTALLISTNSYSSITCDGEIGGGKNVLTVSGNGTDKLTIIENHYFPNGELMKTTKSKAKFLIAQMSLGFSLSGGEQPKEIVFGTNATSGTADFIDISSNLTFQNIDYVQFLEEVMFCIFLDV